ncbi:MAG: glycerol-3-phosphate 1-O-acyltransferase PlsY [Planctomycetes bacterium]|nr:glycerol-3-phosphate 1-O-acyltransferase PlsY [Planctomycetota bacterium]
MNFVILIIASYLLGSISFAVIIAKAHGKDLRQIGSGNVGATNLSRAVGKKWGYFCFCLDVLKGFLPMFVGGRIISAPPGVLELFLWLIVGIAAVLGHIFPLYLKFKGGKGVATSFGIALGLWPYYTICAGVTFLAWIIVVLKWRYISLGSIVGSIVFPVSLIILTIAKPDWDFVHLWPLVLASVGIPVMVILRHCENIKRISAGTENKVFSKEASA